jgi:hypothetical protein
MPSGAHIVTGDEGMKLAETNFDNTMTGCCAPLDVASWDEKVVNWQDKPFLRDHIHAFLHIPLDFGAVMRRDHAAIEAASAYPQEPISLTDERSPWGMDVFTAVDRDVPGQRIEKLSGTFLTKVFEGPYRDAGRWVREMTEYARREGRQVRKIYFFYATCPKCSKRLGRNQVVLLAHVS